MAGQTLRTAFDGGAFSSDFGPLLWRGIDRQIGLTERLAATAHDQRHPSSIDHPLRDLFAQRLSQIASGYADSNKERILLHLPSSYPVKALLHRVTALLSAVLLPLVHTS